MQCENTQLMRLCWILQIVLWSEAFLLGRFCVAPWGETPFFDDATKGSCSQVPTKTCCALCRTSKIEAFGLCVFFFRKAFNLLQVGRSFVGRLGCEEGSLNYKLPILGGIKQCKFVWYFFLGGFPLNGGIVWVFLWDSLMTPCVKLPWISSWHQLSRSSDLPTARWHQMRWRSPRILFHPPGAVLETSGDGAILFHVIDKGICT